MKKTPSYLASTARAEEKDDLLAVFDLQILYDLVLWSNVMGNVQLLYDMQPSKKYIPAEARSNSLKF